MNQTLSFTAFDLDSKVMNLELMPEQVKILGIIGKKLILWHMWKARQLGE